MKIRTLGKISKLPPNRFSKFYKGGGGVYKCEDCGKLTRDTSGSGRSTKVCEVCEQSEQWYNWESNDGSDQLAERDRIMKLIKFVRKADYQYEDAMASSLSLGVKQTFIDEYNSEVKPAKEELKQLESENSMAFQCAKFRVAEEDINEDVNQKAKRKEINFVAGIDK